MFRVHIHRAIEATSFTLEGKLKGPFVLELENCWRAEMSAGPINRVVVDLAAVSFVGAQDKELLREMSRQGATLVAQGCLTRAIVERSKRG